MKQTMTKSRSKKSKKKGEDEKKKKKSTPRTQERRQHARGIRILTLYFRLARSAGGV